MFTEREKEIYAKYKEFIKPEKGPQHTLMCFGLMCDDGWFTILENLFEKISKVEKPADFEIIEVKEKLGGLRVYTNCSTEEIENMIDEACAEADKTCEVCGSPNGHLSQRNYWYKTLCPKCITEKKEYAGYEKIEEREEEKPQ